MASWQVFRHGQSATIRSANSGSALIAECIEAIEAGRPFDRERVLEREPELAAELAAFLDNQEHLGRLAGLGGPRNRPPAAPCPASANEETYMEPAILPYPAGRGAPPDGAGQAVHYFGDYELMQVIAQGGMGVIYRARQVSLNRLLALKLIRAGRLARPDDLIRFQLEARAAAQLDHPHIVPIYEVGEHAGHPYFSMKLVDGGNLASQAARFHGQPRAAARLMAAVARAVHYAHQHGILHRDLKPANILLAGKSDDPPDTLWPMVTDFGLAKQVDATEPGGLTSSGSILGTPGYMAPEQAEGMRAGVTTAADTYALGAIFYELLTGRPPFRADSVLEILRQVREEEPPSPRSIAPRVPRDLETIVLKCLEKNPSQRYASAEALAADIDRWLGDLPIHARPATPVRRLLKSARRRPAAASLVVLAGLFSLATALAIRGQLVSARLQSDVVQTGVALDQATHQRARVEAQLGEMQDETYFKQLIAAQRAWENNDPALADELLERCPERLREWEWHHLRRRFHSELQTIHGHDAALCGAAFRPDGSLLTCPNEPRGFRLWETAPESSGGRIPGHEGTMYGLAFDPAGTRMASAEASGLVRVWSLPEGKLEHVFRGHRGWACAISFSADCRMAASAGQDGAVRVWSLSPGQAIETDRPMRVLQGHRAPVLGVAFHPQGSLLASAGQDGTVRLWPLQTGAPAANRILRGHVQAVRCVAFHPRGHVLASAGADRMVRLWDLSTGRELLRFGDFGNRVDGLAFSPDGRTLATASLDRSVRLWDAETGRPLRAFPGHAAPVFSVIFSPDGKKLASVSQDRTVKVWDLTAEPGVRVLSSQHEATARRSDDEPGCPGSLAYRPGAAELAAPDSDHALVIWDLATGRARLAPLDGSKPLTAFQFSPDGQWLAAIGRDRRLHLMDARSLREERTLEDERGGFASLAFSPDGSMLATGGGEPIRLLQKPRGKESGGVNQPRLVRLWDARTGRPLHSLPGHIGSVHALRFTPDGARLVSAGDDGMIRVWDPQTGRLERSLEARRRRCLHWPSAPVDSLSRLRAQTVGSRSGSCPRAGWSRP